MVKVPVMARFGTTLIAGSPPRFLAIRPLAQESNTIPPGGRLLSPILWSVLTVVHSIQLEIGADPGCGRARSARSRFLARCTVVGDHLWRLRSGWTRFGHVEETA
jgi:hypothetical protein